MGKEEKPVGLPTEMVTYRLSDKYRLDICGNGDGISAWLYGANAGVKVEVGEEYRHGNILESVLGELDSSIRYYEHLISVMGGA